MLINWFTVGAQALNFLILVWLLKRFLYGPILAAIDAREKKIAAILADATAKQADAKKDRADFQQKNEAFDQQRIALLKQATDDANAERQHLLDDARKAATALSAKQLEAMRNEAKTLRESVSKRTEQEVFAIARKALADLATASLEERMSEVFTRHLRTMDETSKASLAAALKSATAPAIVRSAFDLPPEPRAAIQNALNETFAMQVNLQFETSPDLVSGIELTTNGQRVGWSISDYLTSVEKGVDTLLNSPAKAASAAEPPIATPPVPPAPKPAAAGAAA